MNDQLESELRTALQGRASLVPGASVQRLTGRDYHPRRSRLTPPVAIGATATVGAAAAAVAAVVSLGAGASNAFAGWTAKPTQPAPGQLAGARASCEQGQSPIAGLPLKLSDTRGPFTFSVYADSTSSATCIKGPSFTASSGMVASSAQNAPAGQILLSSSHRTDRGSQAFSFAEGRTGVGVTGVTVVLDGGTNVQATVGGGWFVAWWPGGQQIKSAEVTTPSGTKTQTFNLSPEIPCGPGCPGGGKDGAVQSGASMSSGSGAGAGQSAQSFSLSR